MSRLHEIGQSLRERPRRWLVTGAAGFIGSNLAEYLLAQGQEVVGVDNFSTGLRRNVDDLVAASSASGGSFTFIEGDLRDLETCRRAVDGADVVLHEAALGSVPRSLADPIATNASNVTGFLNMLVAARDSGPRFVYAASSSTYGDHPALPKREDVIGRPLSPYAVSKYVNELYAGVFHRNFGMEVVGLRYFNVFGRRQDPNGAYAAVIPRWIANLIAGCPCEIFGDGQTSRDFCYVDNVIQANVLAALAPKEALGEVYNVAFGGRTTLTELHELLVCGMRANGREVAHPEPQHREFRSADVRHSQADITKAETRLGYSPEYDVRKGLEETVRWYLDRARGQFTGQELATGEISVA